MDEIDRLKAELAAVSERLRASEERSRLTEQQSALLAVRNASARLQLLAESSVEFSAAAGSFEVLVDVIARRLSAVVGDLCSIRLLSKDGRTVLPGSAVYHPDPEVVAIARKLQVPQALGDGVSGQVAETGKAALLPTVSTADLASRAPEKFRAFVERLAVTSVIVVPLRVRTKILGVISMTRSDPANPYDEDDLVLAQDLADRAALAIENALLVAELEERVVERTARIEKARRDLESFSYSVAHDLRTPLRGISGFSTALLEDYGSKLDAVGRSHLERIVGAAERMSDIIDALLSLARVARTEPRLERVDLSATARDVAAHLRANEPSRNVVFTAEDGLMATGDQRLLRTLLENLLENAWKFTKRCGEARIELGREEEGGVTTFFVRDNGAGFDMESASKLFSPFHRLHAASEFDGTGIGLATVQRIVERHGGHVSAEGALGQGATFRFTLAP